MVTRVRVRSAVRPGICDGQGSRIARIGSLIAARACNHKPFAGTVGVVAAAVLDGVSVTVEAEAVSSGNVSDVKDRTVISGLEEPPLPVSSIAVVHHGAPIRPDSTVGVNVCAAVCVQAFSRVARVL